MLSTATRAAANQRPHSLRRVTTSLVLAFFIPLNGGCAKPQVTIAETYKTFPTSQSVDILHRIPNRTYERVALLRAAQKPNLTGGGRARSYRELAQRAHNLGADAIVITETHTSIEGRKTLHNTDALAIRYAQQSAAPKETLPATKVAESMGAPATHAAPGWLQTAAPDHYTIQLVASRDERAIQRYIEEQNLGGQVAYFKSRREDVFWYALVQGVFPSKAAARTAIDSLAPALRKAAPWPRNIGDIRKIAIP